ncbi:MAG: tetratricopeptide repeat protein [Candidatus Omnitrophota bacterium]
MQNAEQQKTKFKHTDLIISIGIFFFAYFLRMVYLHQYKNNPFFDSPVIDALTNYLFAVRASAGDWFVKGEVVGRGPVYVYFLAFLFKIFGTGFSAARVAQMVLGSVNCILVYFLGKKIFRRSVGVISALICSAYGVLIYFDAEFLYVGLSIFLNLLLLLSLLNTIEKPKIWKWVGCGMLLGGCLQTNATVILFIPLLFVWIFLFIDKKEKKEKEAEPESRKLRFKKAVCIFLIVVLGIGIIVLPFTLRNYLMGGDLVMIGSAIGINLHIGNNPEADGKSVAVPTRDFSYDSKWYDNVLTSALKAAERDVGRELLPSEVSNYWMMKSLGFIITHPIATLGLAARKIFYFFNAYEIAENQSIYFYRIWSPLLKILVFHNKVLAFPFGIICPLALLGIAVSLKRDKATMLLIIFIGAYLILMVIFFVCSRYRASVIPYFIIFAVSALEWYRQQIIERKFKLILFSFIPLLWFFVFCNATIFEVRQEDNSRWFLNMGTAYRNKGQNEKALKSFKAAQKVNPHNPDAMYNLGVLYLEKGEYEKAIEEFKNSINMDKDDSAAYSNMGLALFKQNKLEEAVSSFESALRIDPADVGAAANLGAAFIAKGDFPAALRVLKNGLAKDSKFPPLYLHLGILFENTGKFADAEKAYLTAIKFNQKYFQAHYNLYELYDKMGLAEQALQARIRAMEIFPDMYK